MLADKLGELVSLVRHERQALQELTTIAQGVRSQKVGRVVAEGNMG